MADHDEMISQFANVTGVEHERAKFHLESSAWNLEVAIANFYEGGDEGGVDPVSVDQGSAANPMDADDFDEAEEEPQPLNFRPAKKAKQPKKNSRFGTIGGLRDNEDSSSEEEGQAFYAGGSDTSGQQVLGPPGKKKNPEAMVTDLFKSARDHGAEELESAAPSASGSRGAAFHGTGFRLGETEGEPIQSFAGPRVRQARQEVQMTLKMWKKGFSVGDGDLRQYDDPANKQFLDSIREGSVPQELIRMARGGEVHLNMEDHRTEDFAKPKVAAKAFSGEGHTLGSPAPNVVATPASGANGEGAANSAVEVKVDPAKPVTTLQIRLADGKRMVTKFNLSHTIADIRSHIVSSHPQYAGASFVLMTTFPNKELTEEGDTLEAAKLANAVIMQRLK